MLLWLGLPYTLFYWRKTRGADFVGFHARQASVNVLAATVLCVVHTLLHTAVAGIRGLQEWAAAETGESIPGWMMPALETLAQINRYTLLLELLVLVILSYRASRKAAVGQWSSHVFIPEQYAGLP